MFDNNLANFFWLLLVFMPFSLFGKCCWHRLCRTCQIRAAVTELNRRATQAYRRAARKHPPARVRELRETLTEVDEALDSASAIVKALRAAAQKVPADDESRQILANLLVVVAETTSSLDETRRLVARKLYLRIHNARG